MSEQPVDRITRRAAATITRRNSLLTAGSAALTSAVAGPVATEAGKAAKKARKNVKKTCRRQGAPCAAFAGDFCALFNPPGLAFDACLARTAPCCGSITQCQGEAFFDCLFEAVASI